MIMESRVRKFVCAVCGEKVVYEVSDAGFYYVSCGCATKDMVRSKPGEPLFENMKERSEHFSNGVYPGLRA